MPGSVTNVQQVLPVPAGTEVPAAAITGTGDAGLDGTRAPYTFVKDAANPAASVPLLGVAQDGTDSSDANAVQAQAGVGIRGWLSTLVSLLRAGTARISLAPAATATLSSVAASTAPGGVPLVPANPGRKGLIVVNDSTSAGYIAYADTASASAYTVYMPGSTGGVPYQWEMPRPVYTGALAALSAGATGAWHVTETA